VLVFIRLAFSGLLSRFLPTERTALHSLRPEHAKATTTGKSDHLPLACSIPRKRGTISIAIGKAQQSFRTQPGHPGHANFMKKEESSRNFSA
jgi:hypothetical protein